MRIAVVTTSWPLCADDAAGHFVEADAREHANRGAAVVVITPRIAARSATSALGAPLFAGMQVVQVRSGDAFGWPGLAARLHAAPWRAFGAAGFLFGARAALAAHGPFDAIEAHWWPCAWPLTWGIASALDVVSHGADVRLLRALPRAARELIVLRIAARARSWRFVSAPLVQSLLDALGPAATGAVSRIARVAPSAFHVPRLPGSISRSGTGGFVTVGRLVRSKRVDRAIAHVASAHPGARLTIVGDGPERRRLEALARARGVHAAFVGQVSRSEALAHMCAAEALLFASGEEGCSTVLREAAALAVPVLHLL